MEKSWTTLSTEVLHENPFWMYKVDQFQTLNGSQGSYFYHENRDSVNIFAQGEDGRFVFVNEYRYLFDTESIAPAMGGIEEGETPDVAAARELREELGYEADEWILLGVTATAPAFSREKAYIFLARNLTLRGVELEGFEDIEPVFLDPLEVEEAIANGTIWDAHTVAGWHFVERYLRMH